jgi:RND family efflux transporter MFP subunit
MRTGACAGRALAALLALAAAAALGCERNLYVAPPPPSVTVARPVVQDVVRYAEYTGTTRAVESAELRARVKGFLQSMHFVPGQSVAKGKLLFVIDPEPFRVALAAAEAELASSRAERDLAQTEFERTRTMHKRGATSEIDLLRTRARRDKAAAAVASAEAAVRAAQLDLDYAHVKAPFAGRVGRHLVDLGNLVGADGPTQLAELVRYSPLHVYFYVSERDILRLQRDSRERRQRDGRAFEGRERARIEVGRTDEAGFPHAGMIDYTALRIDAATGTFEVRGVLDNEGDPDEVIIPGTFVRVRLPLEAHDDALLVSERAIGADQSGRYLLVVDAENVVEQRPVVLGAQIGELRVIEQGLRPDDWVIVKGLQRARPGVRVEAKRAEPAPASPPAAPAPAG